MTEAKKQPVTRSTVEFRIVVEKDKGEKEARTKVKVKPKHLDVTPGDTIGFRNTTGSDAVLMFPMPWFGQDNLVVPVPPGEAAVVLQASRRQRREHCGKYVPYQIYCTVNNDYAIGASPPKMKISPPPDQRNPDPGDDPPD